LHTCPEKFKYENKYCSGRDEKKIHAQLFRRLDWGRPIRDFSNLSILPAELSKMSSALRGGPLDFFGGGGGVEIIAHYGHKFPP
jgi:hypothetical protein